MRLNQINISRIDYNNTLRQLKNEKNDIQGGNFSFTPSVNLDRGLNKILRKIRGYPTVLRTGNGYHIYQPMDGFILEEEDRFARLREPDGKDLTSKFMQFAEEFLTNKKRDPQHNPSVNSCLVRVLGTINSKCGHEVKIIQRWEGQRPAINYRPGKRV